MVDEMSLALIRLWCEVLEDANPLYHDPEFARTSQYGGIVAPPTMLMPLCQQAEWTPNGNAPSTLESLQLSLPEYPNAASLKTMQTYERPLLPGERPTIHLYESEPSPEQMTARGPGRVITRFFSFQDRDGHAFASHCLEILRYRDNGKPARVASESARRPPEGSQLKRRRPEEGPPRWDEIHVGDAIAPLSMPLTLKRCIKWVAATRDFLEVHHDKEWARRAGADDIYIGVDFFHGLAGRYCTDWSGPQGMLRRLELNAFGRCYPGDQIDVWGRIDRMFEVGSEAFVDIRLSFANERGVTHEAVVTVCLPRS
jgi:acyl dehydratase